MPVVGRWAIVDPDVLPGRGAANSAQRVAAVGRRFALQAEDLAGQRVLLVDDLVVTGWTLTLAARAIRAAGAAPRSGRWCWRPPAEQQSVIQHRRTFRLPAALPGLPPPRGGGQGRRPAGQCLAREHPDRGT